MAPVCSWPAHCMVLSQSSRWPSHCTAKYSQSPHDPSCRTWTLTCRTTVWIHIPLSFPLSLSHFLSSPYSLIPRPISSFYTWEGVWKQGYITPPFLTPLTPSTHLPLTPHLPHLYMKAYCSLLLDRPSRSLTLSAYVTVLCKSDTPPNINRETDMTSLIPSLLTTGGESGIQSCSSGGYKIATVYSGKLSREKTFSRSSWFCGSFLHKICPLVGQKWGICKSFLCENRIFHQFTQVFSCESFPLYSNLILDCKLMMRN